MHPSSHLPPNPGPFNPLAGHLGPKPPLPQGIPGLPVPLGGAPPMSLAALGRTNGLHPLPNMPLPTPPPLVSVPQNTVASTLPHIIPPPPPPPRSTGAVTTVTNASRPHMTSVTPSLNPSLNPPPPLPTATSVPSHMPAPELNNAQRRPRSPDSDKPPVSPKRARSRSPIVADEDSDSDIEPVRSPEPDATVVDEECHRSKHAIFIKHLSRGWNTCSRCDFQFRPTPESSLLKPKEERSPPATSSTTNKSLCSPPTGKEPDPRRDDGQRDVSRKEERRPEDDKAEKMKSESPQSGSSLKPPDHTSSSSASLPIHSPPHLPYPGRHSSPPGGSTSRPYSVPGSHDPTPALRTLSDYARPHLLGDPHRGLPPMTLPSGLPQHPLDPYYRMASMYPPGSRERLELELDREKRERDARERDLRERELREMELREKMKQELEMKPPGFERLLPPGANPMDPYWTELLKRYAAIPGGQSAGAPPPPPSHLPGVYPPANLSNDLIARERERIERLGEAARASGSADPLRNANAAIYEYYQRISYEQIVLHRQMANQAGAKFPPTPEPGADPARMAEFARLAQNFTRADPLSSNLPPQPSGAIPAHGIPPGHPVSDIIRQTDALYRDFLSRPPYSTDPVLAYQLSLNLSAHQEALIQRHLMAERERERLSSAAPGGPHMPR